MNSKEIIKKIEDFEKKYFEISKEGKGYYYDSFYVTVIQFIMNYIGKDTEFYKNLEECGKTTKYSNKGVCALEALRSIKDYLNFDLEIHNSEIYKIKIDIINDFMEQTFKLANDRAFHPAAASILMGASLEEFLKKLAEEKEIDISEISKTIDPIAKKLYENKIITKQDMKDITSWAGIRNDATHGNFEEVNDRKRVLNAIEGVNLFMRKYNY